MNSYRSGPFAWSYSQLKNYETCPKRYYHYNVAKDVQEPETEQLREGNRLHAAFDARIAKGTPLPLGLGQFEPALAKFIAAPGETVAERKLALSAEFKPVAFFSKMPPVWFRTVIDAAKMEYDQGIARVADWKTGKVAHDLTQLQLMAATIFHSDPRIQRVKSSLVFVYHNRTEPAEFVRSDLTEIWNEILPRVRMVQKARDSQEFPPKPSRLCRRYCAVSSCPHHGR